VDGVNEQKEKSGKNKENIDKIKKMKYNYS